VTNGYQLDYFFLGTQMVGGALAYLLLNIQKQIEVNEIIKKE
jgi:hypothetical protein